MTNPETLSNKDPLERIKEEKNDLLKWLKKFKEDHPWITKYPEIRTDWIVYFDYSKNWEKREIVTKKDNNKYSIRIKKWNELPNWKMWWQTQKISDKETYDFNANDKNAFNHQLWNALDTIIGTNRDKMPKIWWLVYDYLNNNVGPATSKSQDKDWKKTNIETWWDKTNLKEKPIDLKYKKKHKEKKVEINFPKNHYSVEWRVTRCLRWSSITDAVEDRYWIPRWLLMALMAQEWWWDPTVINQSKWWKCDGWAWLIHMQAINAANFWLNTIQRNTNGMIDYEHWKRLQKAKSDNNNDLKKLSELDDRFNPVLSVDASARFLLNEYKNLPENKRWTDRWLHAINKYAGRWMQDYGYSVVVYRTTINTIRGNQMPKFTEEIEKVKKWEVSAKVNQTREKTNLCINRTRETIKNLNITLDWEAVSYEKYLKYQEWQCDNFWLSKYTSFNKDHPYKE